MVNSGQRQRANVTAHNHLMFARHHRYQLSWFQAVIAAACLVLTGCRPPTPPPSGYYGDTLAMADVITNINDNNARINTLWAKVSDYKTTIYDDKNKPHVAHGEGTLIYLKPGHMRMVGNMIGAGRIFEIGSNADRYWLIAKPAELMWWGWYRNLGKACAKNAPIPPDLVTEVFGVSDIARDFLREPVPTMRFNNEKDAYMFIWNVQAPDRWIARKEVWYDRASFLPIRVSFYDDDGRVLLRAELSDHQPIEIEGSDEGQPKVATKYNLFFPDTKTTMLFSLANVRPRNRGVPTVRSFPFPLEPQVDQIVQIDEACN